MFNFFEPVVLVQTAGLIGVVAIIFAETGLFFGFFLPGDSLLFTAGFLASKGYINVFSLFILAFVAAVLGDSLGYAFGKRVGPKIFTNEESFFFRKSHIDRTRRFYERYGKKTILLARFVPIIRTFAPIMAGVGAMPYRSFFLYNIVGGFVWTAGLVFAGFALPQVMPGADRYITLIIFAIIAVSLIPGITSFWQSRRETLRGK